MKQLKTMTLALAGMLALGMVACKKEDKKNGENPGNDVKITITSPSEGQQFEYNQLIELKGHIESENELHGYELIVRQISDNHTVYHANEHKHAHAHDFTFSYLWTNNVEGMQDMELILNVYIDHEGNVVTKKVNFHCHGEEDTEHGGHE